MRTIGHLFGLPEWSSMLGKNIYVIGYGLGLDPASMCTLPFITQCIMLCGGSG